jgi:biopolymer transport protein ExbD
MKANDEDKPYDDINITPMLDLAYVLMIIFIIMCTASVQGIKVNLPKASSAPSLAKPKTVAISINEQGKIFMDAIPVASIDELKARLTQRKAQDPNFPVVVKGDAQVQYKNVRDVLAMLGELNLTQVGLATQHAN